MGYKHGYHLKEQDKNTDRGWRKKMLFILKKITEFERNTCCGFILSHMSSIHAKMEERNKTKYRLPF